MREKQKKLKLFNHQIDEEKYKNIESKVRPRFETKKITILRYFGLQCYQSSKANAFKKNHRK